MYFLQGLNQDSPQPVIIPLAGLANAQMTLTFSPTQNLWYFDLVWNDFEVDGCVVVSTPNLLRQWENILPFGIGCYCQDGQDPYGIDAFSSGNAQMYLLTADELPTVEASLYPGN